MSRSDNEDVRKKFREALDKKNRRTVTATDHKDGGPKVSNTHGPADHQKMFRRKSV